jgi:hypothetical protein
MKNSKNHLQCGLGQLYFKSDTGTDEVMKENVKAIYKYRTLLTYQTVFMLLFRN